MIIDDPDEDADSVHDEALVAAYLGHDTPAATAQIQSADNLPDWPPRRTHEVELTMETATVEWFKRNHSDWRHEMAIVLRGWIVAQSGIIDSSGTNI